MVLARNQVIMTELGCVSPRTCQPVAAYGRTVSRFRCRSPSGEPTDSKEISASRQVSRRPFHLSAIHHRQYGGKPHRPRNTDRQLDASAQDSQPSSLHLRTVRMPHASAQKSVCQPSPSVVRRTGRVIQPGCSVRASSSAKAWASATSTASGSTRSSSRACRRRRSE